MIRTAVLGGIVGFALGTFVTMLALVVASILAFTQWTRIEIPGIFTVWGDSSEGSPGLAFQPNLIGMVLAIVVITLGCVALAIYARSRSAVR